MHSGVMHNRAIKSFGHGGIGAGDGARVGKIVVENTVAIKYWSGESLDGRSCASVTDTSVAGLVEDHASGEDETSSLGKGSGRSRSR